MIARSLRCLALVICVVLAPAAAWAGAAGATAAPKTLDDLLRQVLEERKLEAEANAERERRFTEERDRQQARVDEANARLAAEQARSDALRQTYARQQEELEQSRRAVKEAAGEVADLQASVKQLASDIEGMLQASMVSAQHPGRAARAAEIGSRQGIPAVAELEELWHLLVQEAVEGGKSVRFQARVVTGEGREEQRPVTRVGTFTALAEGRFLRYLPESGQLLMPERQPDAHLVDLAGAFAAASPGTILPVPIDPTRGAILALLVKRPTLLERIQQAEAVGYLIIALGLIALLAVIERFVTLTWTRGKVKAQMKSDRIRSDNPLGRLRTVAEKNKSVDAETLGLKLDEAILIEVPRLRKRLPMLAVLATAAPLLGLLGTVAGMIETFQAMTLFGAGDPKVVSGGISLALVATELGLVVAIPILLLHAWLHGISNQIIHALEQEAARLIADREEDRLAAIAAAN